MLGLGLYAGWAVGATGDGAIGTGEIVVYTPGWGCLVRAHISLSALEGRPRFLPGGTTVATGADTGGLDVEGDNAGRPFGDGRGCMLIGWLVVVVAAVL